MQILRRVGRIRHRRLWLTVGILFLLLIVAPIVAIYIYVATVSLPRAPRELQATTVYDSSGHLLATFSEQYRVDVPLARVPPVVVQAVVSTEDRSYFSEGALNPLSIVRAALNDVTGGSGLQGGSTITQQYVKQAYLSSERTLLRKIKEAALAIKLSRTESKNQILQGYLNIIYWGRGAYGVQAAAHAYFGKDASQLGLREASLLAGLIREPETADPARNPGLARHNQTETLNAMVRDKKISAQQALAVEQTPFSAYVLPPPSVLDHSQSSNLGSEYFLEAVRQQLYTKYGRRTVDGGGLKVTTTLDEGMQAKAYSSIYGGTSPLDPSKGDPSGALVSIDGNGMVRALVGGQNYAQSTVDLALGAAGGGSGRQAGSTFKAIMLAELIREGYDVRSVVPAPPKVVLPGGNSNGTDWVVTNYEHESVAPQMNLIDATALSVNTVYAQIVARLGADKLDAMAEEMGVSPTELGRPYPSQVLGAADVSPLEMASAFATLAAGGTYHTPILVTSVTDPAGHQLPLPVQPSAHQVLTPAEAATESYVLQQVVARGTGTAAGGVGSPVAGKTGTTETAGDAWFIGYTPKLATALWMGYSDSEKSMDGFRGIASLAGGTLPAQMWHAYMTAVLKAEPQYAGAFPAPTLGGRPFQPWALKGDVISVGSTIPTAPTSTTSSSTTTTTQPGPPTTPGTNPSVPAPGGNPGPPPPGPAPSPPQTYPPQTYPPQTYPPQTNPPSPNCTTTTTTGSGRSSRGTTTTSAPNC